MPSCTKGIGIQRLGALTSLHNSPREPKLGWLRDFTWSSARQGCVGFVRFFALKNRYEIQLCCGCF